MNHYVFGFVIGAVIGAATVALTSTRSGPALRAALSDAVHEALEVGQDAKAAKEQQLWADFRAAQAPNIDNSLAPLDGPYPKMY